MNAGTSFIRLVNSQLRYYMHVDPATLTDNEWAMMWNDLKWIREQERINGFEEIIKKA